MSHTQHSRREVLKLLGAAPFIASHAGAPATSVQPAVPPARAKLCLVSRHLQWTNMEEGVSVAAEAGCKAIAWTVRQGAHMLPANVERDLPKAVELAHKAGLDTPMLITALNDVKSELARLNDSQKSQLAVLDDIRTTLKKGLVVSTTQTTQSSEKPPEADGHIRRTNAVSPVAR